MAGTVDANGVLWKSTKVGSFAESFGGCTNLYDTLAASAKKQGDKPAAGPLRVFSNFSQHAPWEYTIPRCCGRAALARGAAQAGASRAPPRPQRPQARAASPAPSAL